MRGMILGTPMIKTVSIKTRTCINVKQWSNGIHRDIYEYDRNNEHKHKGDTTSLKRNSQYK